MFEFDWSDDQPNAIGELAVDAMKELFWFRDQTTIPDKIVVFVGAHLAEEPVEEPVEEEPAEEHAEEKFELDVTRPRLVLEALRDKDNILVVTPPRRCLPGVFEEDITSTGLLDIVLRAWYAIRVKQVEHGLDYGDKTVFLFHVLCTLDDMDEWNNEFN